MGLPRGLPIKPATLTPMANKLQDTEGPHGTAPGQALRHILQWTPTQWAMRGAPVCGRRGSVFPGQPPFLVLKLHPSPFVPAPHPSLPRSHSAPRGPEADFIVHPGAYGTLAFLSVFQ